MKQCNILCFLLLIGITLCGCQAQPDRCIAEPHIRLGEKDTIDCETQKYIDIFRFVAYTIDISKLLNVR